ncbi:MAG: hypothetical protein K0R72_959 [Clostridia bacterium]|jgi:2-hydroxy-3-keto-5-methylthiopentenyl-1-phosphate phosphatase|nr:hypothetical protein [Clostridia bacterium]
MVYIDDNTKEKIQKLKSDSIYFLINFDNVITDYNSNDTWSTITNNIKLKRKYIKKSEELNSKYKAVELNTSLEFDNKCELIEKIWEESITILKDLNCEEKKLRQIISNKSNLKIRDGLKDFLKFNFEKSIPVIIISDGIYEVIKYFLELNDCNYDNIVIIANSILSDYSNSVIHPLNKNELSLPDSLKDKIKDRKVSFLMASSINDINMLSKEKLKDSIKIAFLDKNINENFDIFLNYFNIIYTHSTSLELLTSKLKGI